MTENTGVRVLGHRWAATRFKSPAFSAAVARALTFPLLSVCGFMLVRIQIFGLGVQDYAVLAVLVGLPALVPFLDLGVGAAIVNAVATGSKSEISGVLSRSWRVLGCGSLFLIAADVILLATNTWPTILGLGREQSSIAAFAYTALFALNLPLGQGVRVLMGAGRMTLVVLAQAVGVPISLALVALCYESSATLIWYACALGVGPIGANVLGNWLARRVVGIPVLVRPQRLAQRRTPNPVGIGAFAVPMFAITVSSAVSFQADRLILSHAGSPDQVAQYSLGSQMFAPLFSVIVMAGSALWPQFAKEKLADPTGLRRHFHQSLTAFATGGAALALALGILGPHVGRFMGNGKVATPPSLYLMFGLFLFVYAIHYPSGMLLSDAAGLRLQAKCAVAMAFANVAVSMLLVPKYGATGPVFGSLLTFTPLMMIPTLRRALRTIRA